MESQIVATARTALPDSVRVQHDRSERRDIRPELFSYRLLKPRETGPADVALIGEAYRCWSDVWSEALLELEGASHLPSDEFTRQDEIGAIFYGYECVALCCFRYVDLASPMHHDDSYFRIWPWQARTAACREGQKICVASHITVARDWRRSALKSSLKGVLTAISLDRFSASGSDALVGTMRDDRGMSKMTASLGADTLGHGELHGVPVTLIAFYKSSLRPPLPAEDEHLVRGLGASFGGGRQ